MPIVTSFPNRASCYPVRFVARSSTTEAMEHLPSPTSAPYTVSRSRGKQPGESRYTSRLREMRKAKGQARSSDESESEDEMEPGEFAQGA